MVIPPNNVRTAYESFLAAFQRAAEQAGHSVKAADRPIQSLFSKVAGDKAAFEHCLYLEKWPSRRLGATKRLDVAVKALEEFSTEPQWMLIKSTVYLNYILVSDSKGQLVQALHYDFDGKSVPITPHPLFHVQLHHDFIPVDELRSANSAFDLELIEPSADDECLGTTRIPTPDMTFTSVLYCLVADHLATPIFKEFSEEVCPILRDRIAPPNFDSIKKSMGESPEHFKSSHWFSHI